MKKLLPFILIIVLLLIIKNIISSIASLSQTKHIVTSLETQLKAKEQERSFQQQKLYYVKSDEFVEKQARQKLGMAKEGEYIVIGPAAAAPQEQKSPIAKKVPNWKKWYNLFF